MSRSADFFLKPTHYISKEDHQLQASVQMICEHKQKGGLSGHALAVSQAVRSIALALLVNTPYYFALGSKNFILNCVHLNLELIVLGHYSAVMQNLIYSVIATIYVAIGSFIPSVLDGFKIRGSNDLLIPLNSSLNITEGSSEKSETGNFTPPFNRHGSDMHSYKEDENRDSISSEQRSSQANSMPMSSDLISGDWSIIPNVESSAIKSANICVRDMLGPYGINLERQAYRIALNEYVRILQDDFNMNVEEKLKNLEGWLKSPTYKNNPIIGALYRTLFYLTRPVAYDDKSPIYTHAKEQYEKYVTSLREVIVKKQYQSIRKNPNLNQDLRECLTLTRTLCEARFRSENHGFLRSLLQLHEDEYDREHKPIEIPAVTRENFVQVVMAKNTKVKEAPASMKVSSTQKNCRMLQGAIGYEDFLMTDIPFLRGIQVFKNDKEEERSFYYMRHPTPHVEGSPIWITLGAMSRLTGLGQIESAEALAPEFEEMLEAIAQRKESYLIQSHQRLNDVGKVENEDSRSQALYRLQASHKNFYVVFQAVEGDLFDRRNCYAQIRTFAGLKEAIKSSFDYEQRDVSPNRLPACLEKDKKYRSVMDQLLNQVHQTLFKGRSAISFDRQDPTRPGKNYPNYEWQAFILAFYILQGDDLKFRLPNVKYFCTNCKNFFDRGGNRAMAEDRLHQEMSTQEVTTDDLEATIANLIPVPLQSKGKAVIEKRLKPGLALAEILATLPLEDRQRLQEIRFQEGYKPESFKVNQKEQPAVFLIEEVCTLQEMQDMLRALQKKKEPYLIKDHEIVQKNWKPYQGKDQELLFKQIDSDLNRLEVRVNGTRYDAQGSNNAEGIFAFLINSGISKELALQAMAQMQQSILLEPLSGLTTAFRNDRLGLSVTHDASGENMKIHVTITDNIEIKAQNSLLYKITDLKSPYLDKSPIAIFDTKVLVTIPKDGSASHAHWTWEVADVL